MSHFLLAVFSSYENTVEALLEPYYQDTAFPQFRAFEDETAQIENEYSNGTDDAIQGPDGKLYSRWDRRFKTGIPGGFKSVVRPVKEIYPTIEEFALEHYGCMRNKHGHLGYWYNPDTRWDWYQIGGRWPGMLILKEGEDGERGLVTLLADDEFRENAYKPYKGRERVDQALIKDVDWEMMKQAGIEDAEKYWEEVQAEIQDGILYYQRLYGNMTKDEFLEERSLFSTFAVITPDGEWYDKGDMWFSTADGEKEWTVSYFDRFIETANPNWTLTIVDCHI